MMGAKGLSFSPPNAKTRSLEGRKGYPYGRVWSFSLLAGWTCPGAEKCLAKAVLDGDRFRLKRGGKATFTCFSASQEALYPPVYRQRKRNMDILQAMGGDSQAMADAILGAMSKKIRCVRLHVSGDFWRWEYLEAWRRVAIAQPCVLFYGYTKSLPHLERVLRGGEEWPDNLRITMSAGGRFDKMIPDLKSLAGERGIPLKTAYVVHCTEQAVSRGWEIDHDDYHAARRGSEDFALLLHGTQAKGSDAALAIRALRVQGESFSYSKRGRSDG